MRHQPFIGDGADDALDFGREQFYLGLRFEFRVAVLDRDDRGEALAHIVAGDLRILFLQQIRLTWRID